MSSCRVLIAGGGVAGLEALAALRALAGAMLDITLLSPSPAFRLRADAVAAAFGRPAPPQRDVARIAADHDAAFVADALHAVHRERRTVLTEGGRALGYDALLLAVGAHARPHPALHDALTFRGMDDVPALAALLGDLEEGRARDALFVVPPGATWTLPIYELALMCAERVRERGAGVALTLATPEARPLGALGEGPVLAVERALQERGIALRAHLPIARLDHGRLLDVRGATLAHAQRVVALPLLTGPAVRGLPHDRDGFVPVDEHGAIRGVPGAYGAGDATTQPYKQGGLAAQQADAAARAIARAAGADVAAQALQPSLRAHPAAGGLPAWLWAPVSGTAGPVVTADAPLWWPPTKVSMPYLAPYLEGSGTST